MYRFMNDHFLSAGAPAIAVAKMEDDTEIRVDLRTWMEVEPYYRGSYDAEHLSKIKDLLDPSGWFLDIGAHIGFYSIAVSKYMYEQDRGGKVMAFEPHPSNFSRLQKNLKINGLNSLCECFNVAVSDTQSTMDLIMREEFEMGGSTGNASLSTEEGPESQFEKVEVQSLSLDKKLNSLKTGNKSIDFVKMDVEGHEDKVFKGGKKVINFFKPKILTEINRHYYRRRGLNANKVLEESIPDFYNKFKLEGGNLIEKKFLSSFDDLDDVLLIP